jgi:hypothetical protein
MERISVRTAVTSVTIVYEVVQYIGIEGRVEEYKITFGIQHHVSQAIQVSRSAARHWQVPTIFVRRLPGLR